MGESDEINADDEIVPTERSNKCCRGVVTAHVNFLTFFSAKGRENNVDKEII